MGNDLISNSQSGLRHFHSTVSVLLEATNNIGSTDNIDSGNNVAVVFFNLKNAFDTVDHGKTAWYLGLL